MADKIIELTPAESGWRAIFGNADAGEETAESRIVAWALVESTSKERSVVGMIVDPFSPGTIVPAPEATSPIAGPFHRYGYAPRQSG